MSGKVLTLLKEIERLSDAQKEELLASLEKQETRAWTALSEGSFAEDWRCPEDAVYDRL